MSTDFIPDLSFLQELSNNDRDFMDQILQTCKNELPRMMEEVQEHTTMKSNLKLTAVLHQIKPTLVLLGQTFLRDKIQDLESIDPQDSPAIFWEKAITINTDFQQMGSQMISWINHNTASKE